MENREDTAAPSDPTQILLGSCGFELGLAGLAILLGWAAGPDPRELIPQPGQWRQIGIGLLYGTVASVPWMLVLLILNKIPWKWLQDLFSTSLHALEFLKPLGTWELAALAASAGVGEELLFRGWLQYSLSGPVNEWTTANLTSAILVSSVIFGLVHAISRAYVVFAFLMSAYLGVLFVVTGNLLVPVVTHAVYDFFALMMLSSHLHSGVTDGDEAQSNGQPQDGAANKSSDKAE